MWSTPSIRTWAYHFSVDCPRRVRKFSECDRGWVVCANTRIEEIRRGETSEGADYGSVGLSELEGHLRYIGNNLAF